MDFDSLLRGLYQWLVEIQGKIIYFTFILFFDF